MTRYTSTCAAGTLDYVEPAACSPRMCCVLKQVGRHEQGPLVRIQYMFVQTSCLTQTWRPTQYVVAPVHVETDMIGPGFARSVLTHDMFESYSILATVYTLVALAHSTPWMRCSSFCVRAERSPCLVRARTKCAMCPICVFPVMCYIAGGGDAHASCTDTRSLVTIQLV